MLATLSSHAVPLTILSITTLANRAFALPALSEIINPRQETGGGYPTPVTKTTSYELSHTENVDGYSFNDPASGGAGISLSHSESYTVGYSVTIGADLGLDIDKIFKLGTSVSISLETSKGSSDSVTGTCPTAESGTDQWTCSLSITPSMVQKTGTQISSGYDIETESQPYVIIFPRKSNDNNLVFSAALCSCPDLKGWGSPKAPPKCPQDC